MTEFIPLIGTLATALFGLVGVIFKPQDVHRDARVLERIAPTGQYVTEGSEAAGAYDRMMAAAFDRMNEREATRAARKLSPTNLAALVLVVLVTLALVYGLLQWGLSTDTWFGTVLVVLAIVVGAFGVALCFAGAATVVETPAQTAEREARQKAKRVAKTSKRVAPHS